MKRHKCDNCQTSFEDSDLLKTPSGYRFCSLCYEDVSSIYAPRRESGIGVEVREEDEQPFRGHDKKGGAE